MSQKIQEIADHYAGRRTYELLERYFFGNITDVACKRTSRCPYLEVKVSQPPVIQQRCAVDTLPRASALGG